MMRDQQSIQIGSPIEAIYYINNFFSCRNAFLFLKFLMYDGIPNCLTLI